MSIKIVIEIEGDVGDPTVRDGFERVFDVVVDMAAWSFAPLHCWVSCKELQKKVELLDR